MAIPTDVNYPTSLDDSSTLFGDPLNAKILTLTNTELAADTTFEIDEDLTSLNVPTFFAFPDTGELFYVSGKDVGVGTITVERGTGADDEIAGSTMKQILTAEYISQFKKAIVALETKVGIDGTVTDTVQDYMDGHDHSGGNEGVNIPIGSISGTIDADTLETHAASYFAPDADLTTAEGNIQKSFLETFDMMAGFAPLTGGVAALELGESSGAGTFKVLLPQLLFDATADQGRMWVFRAKQTPRGTAFTLKISYRMASATSGNVIFQCQFACISDTDASMSAKVFDTATSSGAITVPGSADTQDEISISVAVADTDGMALGDWVCLLVYRDATTDTATGNAIVTSIALDYA